MGGRTRDELETEKLVRWLLFAEMGRGEHCKFERKKMITLTLLMYMPWISEITEVISASSAIGDRRERRGLRGGWLRVRRGARTVAWLTQCRSVCMICMYAVNLVSIPRVYAGKTNSNGGTDRRSLRPERFTRMNGRGRTFQWPKRQPPAR